MRAPANPALNQINMRVWLTELSRSLGRPATLDDVPDDALDPWRHAQQLCSPHTETSQVQAAYGSHYLLHVPSYEQGDRKPGARLSP